MVNLVKSLQAAGVPIDGVGIQGHLIVGEVPSTLIANMQQFTALGIEVAITELDIRMTLPATPALYAQQKQDYETVISACNSVPGCIGVTIWDYTDKVSPLPIAATVSIPKWQMLTSIIAVFLGSKYLLWTRSSMFVGRG